MMQRHVHVLDGPDLLSPNWVWDKASNSHVARGNKMEVLLNQKLANGERIVGTHKVTDNKWVIITENLGLGPARTP